MRMWASFLLLTVPLWAQAPAGWNQRRALGEDQPGDPLWYGAGLWAGDHHGPAVTLTDSLGLGNGITGGGFHLEGGFRSGRWDAAAELLGNRDTQGQAYMTLYRSHLWYRGERWQGGFEQEPLVWGYGLNGGYLLGEAARPFPRLRVESPMVDLHLWRVPLGCWGFQAFMGRLENHRILSPEIQDASVRSRQIAQVGDPQAPMFNGYRVQATFGPLMEFYLNYTNLWSGTLNGKGLTSGYGAFDYLTAMTGTKDTFAEANTDFSQPGYSLTGYKNNARSASEMDVGFRLQLTFLARLLAADKASAYISRGSKQEVWPVGVFLKNPPKYFGRDVKKDLDNTFFQPNLGYLWNLNSRYTAPSEGLPNDTVGILVDWPRVRTGLEYSSCDNPASSAFRPFTHGAYLTGFYYYGDPLGNALGGEFIVTTAKVEVDFSSRLTGALTLWHGFRPFRDNLEDWLQDHPGFTPGQNRFNGLQQVLAWRADDITTIDMGASWPRQDAVLYESGRTGNGFAWFTDVTFRWPAPNRSRWFS
jgi:hypothetical protein